MTNKVPEIRFEGFKRNWEQRKFKDFTSKSGKINSENKDLVSYSVSNKEGLVAQSEQFEGSRLDDLDKTGYKFVKPREFAYNPARINVGSIAYNNLEKTVIVSSLYVVIKLNEKLNNDFIFQFIKSEKFNNEVRRNTEGSVREYLFFNNFINIKFPYTKDVDEQKKIGNFFKQMDENIELNQHALHLLKQRKKAFLQKMFPKNGESIPSLRFSDNKESWKKIKMKEILSERKLKQIPSVKFPLVSFTVEKGVTPKSDRYNREFLVRENDKKYKLTKYNDIVYNPANLKFGAISRNNYGNAVFSPIYVTFETNQDPKFVELLVTRQRFINKALKYQEGTVYERQAVKPKDFLEVAAFIPEIEEQIKIGMFFKELDKSINLQEEKLESLKQMKKAFLQKMFV